MNNFHRFHNFRQFSNLFSQIWLQKRQTSLFSGISREIRTKFNQNFSEKVQNLTRKMKKIRNSIIQSRKNVGDFWLKFWVWRTVQRSALCRSRRELSNEYLLAKIGVDTAENEPLEDWGKISIQYSTVSLYESRKSKSKWLRPLTSRMSTAQHCWLHTSCARGVGVSVKLAEVCFKFRR